MAETTLPSFAPGTLDARIDDSALAAAVAATVRRADEERWSDRLHERDVTLWSADPEVQEKIANRLGWLDLPVDFSDQIPALEGFGEAIRDAGFATAIVAGMGGSSLAPEVIATAFGDIEGWLSVRVLDSTDPAAVGATWEGLDPLTTLVIVGSKSGTTTETLAFQADAWRRIHDALRTAGERFESPGELMVAVTDPGKSLAAIPHQDAMRGVFLNPASVGGRYSALSYVGLVPASLAGVDLDPFMADAVSMHARCMMSDPAANPGVALGAALGALARAGRDKLTFVVDPAVPSLGAWLEQLIAESTGKVGTGIVPVDREPLGAPEAYGSDRVFVRIAVDAASRPGRRGTPADALLEALAAAGTRPPLRLPDPHRPGRRVRPLGGGDRDRRHRPARQPVRRAERHGVQGEHEARPRGAGRRGALPHDEPLAVGEAWLSTAIRPCASPRATARSPASCAATSSASARRLPGHRGLRRPDGRPDSGDRPPPGPPARRDGTRHHGRVRPPLPALDRPAPQGRPRRGLVPPAHRRPPCRPAGARQAVHLRPAHRRPGAGRHGGVEAHDLPVLRVHLGADVDAGLAALDAALADAVRQQLPTVRPA